jgi:UDPglucose--hexose-1-phosphate uridylyltransferase
MVSELPHRRKNLLTDEWVLVSPHRTSRPWLGQVERAAEENLPDYDPDCYLCPGNRRAGGVRNPAYESTFVFDNDYAALLPPEASESFTDPVDRLFVRQTVPGICRVVCFSPRHNASIPILPQQDVKAVVETWTAQTHQLGKQESIEYVQIFENKGAMMGASNPHPHSQIWATGYIPNEAQKELKTQSAYHTGSSSCLLCDVLAAEMAMSERIVARNDEFTALVPYWAVWPYEIMVVANRHTGSLMDLREEEKDFLADIIRQVTTRYDNLFETAFPYSMGIHQAPAKNGPYPGWHLHAHFYPPLLRSASVRKFMVGYELLAEPQRDLTPESAADRLRGLPPVHYRLR